MLRGSQSGTKRGSSLDLAAGLGAWLAVFDPYGCQPKEQRGAPPAAESSRHGSTLPGASARSKNSEFRPAPLTFSPSHGSLVHAAGGGGGLAWPGSCLGRQGKCGRSARRAILRGLHTSLERDNGGQRAAGRWVRVIALTVPGPDPKLGLPCRPRMFLLFLASRCCGASSIWLYTEIRMGWTPFGGSASRFLPPLIPAAGAAPRAAAPRVCWLLTPISCRIDLGFPTCMC